MNRVWLLALTGMSVGASCTESTSTPPDDAQPVARADVVSDGSAEVGSDSGADVVSDSNPDVAVSDSGPIVGSTCDANAWVFMGENPNACDGRIGESCGWTETNLGQGYHCAITSWGTGCSPGGTTCPNGSRDAGVVDVSAPDAGAVDAGVVDAASSDGSVASARLVFSPYKDTSINMDWTTNVISTVVPGARTELASDLMAHGGGAVTLAFATGECGSENFGGVAGAAMATANVTRLNRAGLRYIVSTGGAAGSFTCGTDAGFMTFVNRWAGPNLVGIDFDIEAGQSQAAIGDLVRRIQFAHTAYPALRFTLTLATLANNNGASSAQSLGATVANSLNIHGDHTLAAVRSTLGFTGAPSSWPSYLTVNLMTMDYGAPGSGVCVVRDGQCDMGQSAIQAAYNLRDRAGVPLSNIELTPMIGGNDVVSEHFTLADTDTVARFAIANGLAGVHYWSYDRDVDCPAGSASPTCNTLGGVGAHGFLRRFQAAGLR